MQFLKKMIGILSICASMQLAAASVNNPQVVQSSTGDKVAVWDQVNSTTGLKEILSATFASGSWGAPTVLSNTSFDSSAPLLKIDSSNNVSCVWATKDTTQNLKVLSGALFTFVGGWGTSSEISDASVTILTYVLDQTDGIAEACYTGQDTSTSAFHVYSVRNSGTGWTSDGAISGTLPEARNVKKSKNAPLSKKAK